MLDKNKTKIKPKFTRNKLSQAVFSIVAASSLSVPALAQQQITEEVVVTGIKGSLMRAMDIKRDAVGVVDAISAEDIGKFPDTNLAESLQRITGVSIDRRNGEGYQVTVRGFGPQFNLVTINGRALPTSRINISKSGGGNPAADRGFDMSNIAAEGVSGVTVYKSGQADISSGGIGATVDLATRRPFDSDGFTATVGGKLLHDTTTRTGDEITPELSTFLSWSNDMFGASFAFTHQERNSAQTGVFTNGYSAYSGGWTDASFIESVPYTPGANDPVGTPSVGVDDVRIINEPAVGQQTNLTPGIRYYHEDRERTRDNAQVTLQFRPTDKLTATADYTWAEQEVLINGSELSFWFGGGTFPATDVQFDGRSDVASPVYFWAENPTGVVRDLGITQNGGGFNNELKSTGLNIEFLATDTLTLTLDAHRSESESLPADGLVGGYFNVAVGAQGVWAQGYDASGDLPLLVGVYEDDHRDGSGNVGLVEDELDVRDLGSTVRQIWNPRATSEIDQIKLDGRWEFNDSGAIDFGIESRSMESTQRSSFLQEVLEGNWGVGTPGDVPPEMMEELDYADLFDGYRTTLTADGEAFFNASGVKDGSPSGAQAEVFTTSWIAKDVSELGRLLSSNAGLTWEPNPNDGTNRTIKEDITALYVQGSYQFDIADMPLDILAGIRYEETDVESVGQVAASTILWQGDNDLITQSGSVSDAPIQVGEGSYSNTLPNLSLSLGVTDDVKVRAAYSKTISRPSYNNLLQGINGVQAPNGGPTILGAQRGTAQNGNPNLNPLESNNYDLSVEWYYAESSYASIGYFYKDVPNFVGTAVEPTVLNEEVTVNPVRDPTNGPRAQAAIDELESRGLAVNQQNLFRMIASQNLNPAGCIENFGDGETAANSASCGADFDAYGYEGTEGWEDNIDLIAVADGQYADPFYEANVNFPVDTQSATLDGFEFAVQHFFGDTGFGMQANYTIVDGDIEYDITGDPQTTQFALTGLSDSANLVLIYEKSGWSTRLAYNWRDDFLYSTTDSANEPGHTEAYSQLDLNVSYDVTDNLTVSFEGLNLTEEDTRNYARTDQQPLRLDILGARYALSARYSF